MVSSFESAQEKLTAIQRQAVEWDQGPLLVLAGPGSGKTQVLTCRIARLLDGSKGKNFRVLALTFTNKAADEMKGRVAGFVPGLEDRATIGTFHSFCAQILRQHGVHLGINPDFTIYSALIFAGASAGKVQPARDAPIGHGAAPPPTRDAGGFGRRCRLCLTVADGHVRWPLRVYLHPQVTPPGPT